MDFDTCHAATEVGSLPVGFLVPLSSLDPLPQQASDLPSETLVLTGTLALHEAELFDTFYENAALRFGELEVNDIPLVTICFQLGDVQVYWLADQEEAQLQAALKLWQRIRRIPIMFRVRGDVRGHRMVCVVAMPRLADQGAQHGKRVSPPANLWSLLSWLLASGELHKHAATEIPGTPVRHVIANVIVSERLKPFAAAEPSAFGSATGHSQGSTYSSSRVDA
ncbi:hypothetical protein [Caballeronia catudaia]|nr:hypothetical protein [Caballeronia catudaia]